MWKDKSDVRLLTDSYDPPTEGNYHDQYGNTIKPAIVMDYNCDMGHLDNADGSQQLHSQLLNMTVDKTALFPPFRPDHCQ
jgi:hypothetical protein